MGDGEEVTITCASTRADSAKESGKSFTFGKGNLKLARKVNCQHMACSTVAGMAVALHAC